MHSKFEILFLEEARVFLSGLDEKTRAKILYNMDKAKVLIDVDLFKKLTDDIWEFRTRYNGLQYRLLAFWDKIDKAITLVICTHGFVKKTDKVASSEIDKASELRKFYFREKEQ